MGWNGIRYDDNRLAELKELIRIRIESLLQEDLVSDDLNVFVKPEPHKESKLVEGRLRLISAVSLVDTMIDRIAFGWLSRKVLDTLGQTPSRVGWSPIKGGWRPLASKYFGVALCLDKSAWDWTVQEWLVDALFLLVQDLAVDAPDWLRTLMWARFTILFSRARFRFLDGSIVPQVGVGIMKSGCYLTIILNTLAQVIMHCVAARSIGMDAAETIETAPEALGDDTIQDGVGLDLLRYVEALEALGCKVKGAKIRDDLEFAGFRMTKERCVPAYVKKHIFKTEYATDLPAYLRNMQYMHSMEPQMYDWFRRLSLQHSPGSAVPRHEALSFMV